MKKRILILAAAILCAAAFSGCADSSDGVDGSVKIKLRDGGSSADGAGVSCDGGDVTINKSGKYTLSGTLGDGRVTVDATDGEVELILNGVDITSSDGPAIYVRTSAVKVNLADGSENRISDSSDYDENYKNDGANAALFSTGNVEIFGSGSLSVVGSLKHGIHAEGELSINGGKLDIDAEKSAMIGDLSVAVGAGELTLDCSGDGIKSADGDVKISGGVIDIETDRDGVQAESVLSVSGGEINITAGGGSAAELPVDSETGEEESVKGFKAETSIEISGGSINISSADDCIHSNGDISFTGGEAKLASGDDGIHADGALTVSDGVISVAESYEGLEALTLNISGGSVTVRSSDDGLNASDGSGGGIPGFGGSSSVSIEISGGYIYIDADGDGVDSNGSITVSGGILLVSGPVSNDDSALDCDGKAVVSGGTVVAIGSSGMMEGFDEAEGQGVIACAFDRQSAGTPIVLTDEDGNVLMALATDKEYSSAVFTSPDLSLGGKYRIVSGVSPENVDEHGFAQEGTVSGGDVICEIELDDLIYQSGGMMNPFGGGHGNRDFSEMPSGDMPEMPSGDMPEMPSGDMPEMPSGEVPEMPGGSAPGDGGKLDGGIKA